MAPAEEQLTLFEVDALGRPTSTPEVTSSRHASTSRQTTVKPRPRIDSPSPRSALGETSAADPLLSPEDVARRCGLSRKAVYRAVARGELRAARILSRLRLDPRDVEAWIRANIVDNAGPVPRPAPSRLSGATGLRRLLPER
jgi:excisionase family DNA binding protein